MAHHPRFSALSSQYGEMAGTVGAATGSAAQPSAMQELQLVCVAPSAGGRMGTQVKKLPGEGLSCLTFIADVASCRMHACNWAE